MSIQNSDILLSFKAGRAFRREGANVVEPSPTKGAIYLTNGDDGLLHFIWRNRTTNEIEEDLILFPSDASFVKVSHSPGRVYVLKFSSSNQRHFFWMQDASSDRDTEFALNVNGLLQDPEYDCVWNIPITSSTQRASSSTAAQPAASSSTARTGGSSNFEATPEQLTALSNILTSMGGRTNAAAAPSDVSLTDILTPANLTPLFNSHPELISALFPHLPPDLPLPPSAEVLQRIVHSPQFRAAVSNFDQALRTGLLGGLVRTLGLPEEAGTGVGPFLRAIQEQADRERNNSMDTD
ncbi:proteasome complex subunit Rpn13 ubiquitin receptor-domain-containing protein [Crassisporium funariophilum]|nr:proteasome complex subunit Rpn13 ubiquitin receptor-domain-containing protein [Crassisporium funariophilum]